LRHKERLISGLQGAREFMRATVQDLKRFKTSGVSWFEIQEESDQSVPEEFKRVEASW
jgi:hypothetical protein